jgi:branched-chain amino acid aminotransferase
MGYSNSCVLNVSGTLHSAESAKISVFDRSFLYGDSLYEVFRTYGGRPFGFDAHFERLVRSGDLCRMDLRPAIPRLREACLKTLKEFFRKNPGKDAYFRIVITRGIGPIGFHPKGILEPFPFVLYCEDVSRFVPVNWEAGVSLWIPTRKRNPVEALTPEMKSGNYLNSLLAFLEGVENGADDAILESTDGGFLTEGTTFNIYYVRRGMVGTAPTRVGILHGITREWVKKSALEAGIPYREVLYKRENLLEADEIFLSSTLKEVWPVTTLQGKKVGNGKPGPITRKLRETISPLILANLDNVS